MNSESTTCPPSVITEALHRLEGRFKEDWHLRNMNIKRESNNKKKKRKNKVRRFKNQIGPQDLINGNAFASFSNLLTVLKLYSGVQDMDTIVHHIEAFAALCVTLSDATSTNGIISAILMYAKIHLKGSIILALKDYLSELLMENQGPGSDFVENIRDLRDNWKKIKSCNNFGRISQLLGLVVSLGFCSITSLDFSIAGFKVFDTKLIKVHENCVDVFDATLDSIAFLIDGAYECFQQKSLQPLLVDDMRAVAMDEEYTYLTGAWNLIVTGNAREQLDIEPNEFDSRIEKLITHFKALVPSLKGFDKKIVTDKVSKLLNIKNDFITMQISSGVRPAPFCIEAFGESSQGKTTLLDQLIHALLISSDLSTDKSRQATINISDKFMSTWRSDNIVAKIDDACNTKSNFVEKAPTQWIIDLCNNEPFYAPKADLESKGKVFVKPEIVTISTNKKDLDAYTYSHCPYSIQRRAHLVVTVRAKKRFQRYVDGISCGIDHDKVAEFQKQDPNAPFDDIWDIDVEHAVKPNELSYVADYTPFFHNKKKMVGISMQELIEFSIHEFHKHREHQKTIVSRMEKRDDTMKLCGLVCEDGRPCKNIKGCCSIHNPDYTALPTEGPPEPLPVSDDEDDYYENMVFGEEYTQAQKVSHNRRAKKKHERKMKNQLGLEDLKDMYADFVQVNKMPEAPSSEIGDHTSGILQTVIPDMKTIWKSSIISFEVAATSLVYQSTIKFLKHFDWLSILPSSLFQAFPFNRMLDHVVNTQSYQSIRRYQHVSTLCTLGVLPFLIKSKRYGMAGTVPLFWLSSQMLISSGIKHHVRKSLMKRTDTTTPIVTRVRTDHGIKLMQGCAALAGLMLIRTAYKKYVSLGPQGNIVNPSVAEVAKRDQEVNPWACLIPRTVKHSEAANTTTLDQMDNILDKNICHGLFHYDDFTAKATVCFLRTNFFIIPYHYVSKQATFKVELRKENPDAVGGKFTERVEPTNTFRIEGTDLAIVYCATGGSFKDITKYLLDDIPSMHSFRMMYRQRDGSILKATGTGKCQLLSNDCCKFPGILYRDLSMNTFDGLCGAVLYSAGTATSFLGIHVGGQAGQPLGCAAQFTRKQWEIALQHFQKKNFTCQTGCDGIFRPQVLGVEIMLPNQSVPKKSPMYFLPKNTTIEYKGRCIGAITSKSNAVKTSICPIVEKVLGKKNPWQPPKMSPDWWAWQQCLANLAVPSESLPYNLVERAIDDYLEPLIVLIKRHDWKKMKPLNDTENLLGVKGQRFMDAIKKNTAIGAPLVGNKSKYMTQIAGTEEHPHNFVLDEMIVQEIEYCLAEYKQGRRVYPLIKAAKKDEILAKEKCRIFYVNPISLTWVIRKYFLPLIRFLQMNPTISECAVGVNAESREWEQLHDFMTKYDNLVGGDYSKYDQKIPSQLILASFRMLITLASYCDYSEEDLLVMQTLAADVAYAYVMFNGDLVQFISGTHISGNSLTVILNGLVGVLNLRCAFFHHNPTKKRYRDHCAIMTYGDDNAGSISSDVEFGIKTISEFLAKYGQKYTMPDKESELVQFINAEQFEFLKRKTKYIPQIGCHVGALCEESMTKDLYMRIPSKNCELSEDMMNAMNIDGVIRDAFFHGKETYEKYQGLMRSIAVETGLDGKCTMLNTSFDERVHDWRMRYDESYAANFDINTEEEDVRFSSF